MTNPILKLWLPIAFAGSVILGAVYVGVQQDIRSSVNLPQLQIAEDAATFLSSEYTPAAVVPRCVMQVDADRSLAPFVMVFDDRGTLLESSASFSGILLQPPHGVFDYVRAHGEDVLTWQTMSGARIAIVVARFSNTSMVTTGSTTAPVTRSGFVVAGRNLHQAEQDKNRLEIIIFLAWMAMWVGTLIIVLGGSRLKK